LHVLPSDLRKREQGLLQDLALRPFEKGRWAWSAAQPVDDEPFGVHQAGRAAKSFQGPDL
jgi:hypothetical protein